MVMPVVSQRRSIPGLPSGTAGRGPCGIQGHPDGLARVPAACEGRLGAVPPGFQSMAGHFPDSLVLVPRGHLGSWTPSKGHPCRVPFRVFRKLGPCPLSSSGSSTRSDRWPAPVSSLAPQTVLRPASVPLSRRTPFRGPVPPSGFVQLGSRATSSGKPSPTQTRVQAPTSPQVRLAPGDILSPQGNAGGVTGRHAGCLWQPWACARALPRAQWTSVTSWLSPRAGGPPVGLRFFTFKTGIPGARHGRAGIRPVGVSEGENAGLGCGRWEVGSLHPTVQASAHAE